MDQPAAAVVTELPPDFDRWDELLALILRAFAYMEGIIDPPSSAHLLTPENLKHKAQQETGFLAIENGRIVGCVFALERAEDFYVGKLAVEPEHQGQGLGARLMQAVEDLAHRRGKHGIELQTRIELTANQASFARMGFRETGRTAHAGYHRPTSITMRKVVS
ncbi:MULTISPECIES: GNAT family N-acetyltransferase [unclassified Mesorhizobium]|uniref:GNAT family N-acetyltransferase n=1 Tax=unclassified Mesorhizobium TaxID=325217 RepID=UPI000BAF62E2|nr:MULTISPECIES: GNAT family N-acetyltransferase [unclassified Mesorhizobium]TGT54172.1 GNAT family N-acetyltransferase [Mesorhizobium sp. M00.F.Ca.ET.170.01.1.1]AZO09882.1 GNAT family N-acetyltransferase [Mesorhizobium sp. M3A.F.Ca.ET.080.04.2.1]PBB86355.1 GNAT family N-acetyltransferase [Mesorhizobium sp. WSM3876]RWE24461.1 MAG: GNAT family N-acetyltransferase [Mesorhizobium sp.]RWE33528.1 MAG: GNAT family N-acetyltransferase [Mesorhizobium sp.]